MAGLTSNGFEPKRLPDVLESLRQKARDRLGANVNTQPDSVLGQLIDTLGSEIATLWETAEAVYASRDPAAAEGVPLDILAYLIGMSRMSPDKGSVVLTVLTNDHTTVTAVPAGTVFAEELTGLRYTTDDAVTPNLTTCTAFVPVSNLGSVATGNVFTVTINAIANTYTAVAGDTLYDVYAGLVAEVNSNTGSHNWIATMPFGIPFIYSNDNTAVTVSAAFHGASEEYSYVGSPVACTAETYDTRVLSPQSIFNIVNPQATIDSARNILASTAGTDTESDVELRLRRQESLSTAGASTLESIVSKVRGIEGVTSCRGYENTGTVADAYSRPSKSFEIVVLGGTDAAVAQKIYDFKPVGIETTFGNNTASDVSEIIYDENGDAHTINFSRAIPAYAHVRVDYKLYDEERFLESGAQGIADALYDYTTSGVYSVGKDILPQRLYGSIFNAVGGIQSISFKLDTTAAIGDTPTYVTDIPVTVDIRDYALFTRQNIKVCHALSNTVGVTSGSPTVTINAADTAKITAGDTVIFGVETAEYLVNSVVTTTVTLSTNYVGSTNAAYTMVVKKDIV